MKGNIWLLGISMLVLGGASLADHITENVGSFPISAVVFGLGFYLVCISYEKTRR